MKKSLSVAISIITALFVIAFAIAVPITVRSFYYVQITPLGIEKDTGLSRETIVDAFDSVMDYLHGKGEFSTGKLKYSEDGKSHFEDCKKLFDLDYTVLIITAILLILIFVLVRMDKLHFHKFLGLSPLFFSGVGILAFFLVFALWGVIDFNSLFTLFHTVFFPGKSNWIFYPAYDEIITILPAQFFANCAILIFAIIVLFTVCFIVYSLKTRTKNENR